MRSSLPPKLAHLVAIATLAGSTLVAAVPRDSHALVSSLAKCRDQIAKEQTRYVDTLFRSAAACHADRSSGKESLTTDCNDPLAGDLDAIVLRRALSDLRRWRATATAPLPGSPVATPGAAAA